MCCDVIVSKVYILKYLYFIYYYFRDSSLCCKDTMEVYIKHDLNLMCLLCNNVQVTFMLFFLRFCDTTETRKLHWRCGIDTNCFNTCFRYSIVCDNAFTWFWNSDRRGDVCQPEMRGRQQSSQHSNLAAW